MAIFRKLPGTVEILRHMNFTAIPVTLDSDVEVDGKVVVEENGRKIVKAGAFLGTELLNGEEVATIDNSPTADGVLRYDVDVTDGDKAVSLVIRGEIFKEKLPEAPAEGVEEALGSRLLFIE